MTCSDAVRPRLPDSVTAQFSAPLRAEWEQLATESDPQLYQEGVLNLAQRQEQAGCYERAAEFYQSLLSGGASTVRERARARLDALLGRGAVGNRAEFLLRNLAAQASEPSALLAMGVAGTVFRMTRLAALSRLATSTNPGFLTRLLGAGRVASLLGFAAEAPTFTLVGRLGHEALGRPQDWSARALGRDFASSYLVLGGLKFTGMLGRAATERLGNPRFLSPLFQQGSLLSGIMLGHQLETRTGLRSRPDGATTLIDSLAMLLQFHVAGNLIRSGAWGADLDLQGELLSRLPPGGGGAFEAPGSSLSPYLVALGPGSNSVAPERAPKGLQILQMTGRGSGSRGNQALEQAIALRQKITPDEAFQRRAELSADYVKRLLALPPGQTAVLTELLQSIELFGGWAEGSDAFRRAIAFRHYGQLWEGLADKWSHTSLNVAMTESLRAQMRVHRSLLGHDENPRFFPVILKAAPQIARIYSHTLGALITGSPRERELSSDHLQLLAGLRLRFLGTSQEANRALLVEAFHDTLNNTADERLDFAREALQGLQTMRRWMSGNDADRQRLGRRYLPLFWQRFAERGHPDMRENLLSEAQEEIVYLQRTTTPYGKEKELVLPSLRAFPSYVQWVLAVMAEHPMESLSLIRVFVSQAQSLRPWISHHTDPEVREVCASSYLNLLTQLNRQAAGFGHFDQRFPQPVGPELAKETWEAVPVFAARWRSAERKSLASALRDYVALIEQLPVLPEYGADLTSEAHLKPIVRLGYHADAAVRDAAGEIISKILLKFSPNSPEPRGSN